MASVCTVLMRLVSQLYQQRRIKRPNHAGWLFGGDRTVDNINQRAMNHFVAGNQIALVE